LEGFIIDRLSIHALIHAAAQRQLDETFVAHLELRPGHSILAVWDDPAKAEVLIHREIQCRGYDGRSNDAVGLAFGNVAIPAQFTDAGRKLRGAFAEDLFESVLVVVASQQAFDGR